jgi:peptide-methionine (S)-S-oxide reductase
MASERRFRPAHLVVVAILVGLVGLVLALTAGGPAGPARPAVPAVASTFPVPAVDEPVPAGGGTETAVFAGGCFWGVQGVYQHVRGVQRAVSGYAGGSAATAHYEVVGGGDTGHAESVEITYDPRQVTYGQLLRIFFAVVHDPTQLDRQGPDTGTQYRSALFPRNAEQRRVAEAYIAQLTAARVYPGPIVTRIEPAGAGDPPTAFYPAEDYHQDFMNANPRNPYIAINDMPKLEAFQAGFADLYREQPALVAG